MFQHDAERNIIKLQKRLRSKEFRFDPQKGVLKKKASGGTRGLVMASVQNRIVERAWLDCLQDRSKFIQEVIGQHTSVGGVPDRSVPHGLKIISDAFSSGRTYFVRSDISGFFNDIPRDVVLSEIEKDIKDQEFIDILRDATTVTLSNEASLGEDRKAFPMDFHGVAQGSPLSPLFGNVLLLPFDKRFNDRGITCVRFIDDFVILGENSASVRKAFNNARHMLLEFGLTCHDPYDKSVSREKAAFGNAAAGFVFLGYDIQPGLLQPSRKARQSLLSKIDLHIRNGKWAINKVLDAKNGFEERQRYAQTQDLVDKVVRGWGEAFAYGNARQTLDDLDNLISDRLEQFREWYSRKIRLLDRMQRRRAAGVGLLSDITPRSLDDLPFRLGTKTKRKVGKAYREISTDGSVFSPPGKANLAKGLGAWGFIVHDTGEEVSGTEQNTTNNRMELLAVIEALKYCGTDNPIRVRTDSQYVSNIANKGDVVRTNKDLWEIFRNLVNGFDVRIIWVKGHNGDKFNEKADFLVNRLAHEAYRIGNH